MKVLVADDDPLTLRLFGAKLTKWGYEVTPAGDGNEAWQVLQAENAPQVAILDWNMPGLSGVDLCRKIREGRQEPYTYIILLTGMAQEDALVTGMDSGADDYMAKPFKSSEMKVRLRAGRRIIELQNDQIAAREALRIRATHDPLTGIWNHEEILGILERELARAARKGDPVAAIMADLDHFKKVNDTHGHQAGDTVLRGAVKRLQDLLRPYDSIGRYGGEEFLLVLPGCAKKSAAVLAERLRAGIADRPLDIPTGTLPVTGSFGVATSEKEAGIKSAVLVGAADQALYRAKQNGRNRVETAD